jgi:RHS repeat-associated protein
MITFKYDPFGRRIEKISPTTTSIFAYDGDNLVETANASGAVVAQYSQGLNIDEPLAMLRSSTTSYYEADGLGSISSLTSSTGAIANTYTYDSFGNVTNSTGTLRNPFSYTAREFDSETGLYYYRARYYDPASGRFLGEDPLESNSGNNFYEYSYNNTPNFTDASGLQAQPVYVPPPPSLVVIEGGGGATAGGAGLLAGGLITLDLGLAAYDSYQLYNLGLAYGWWHDFLNSGNMQQVHNPNRAKCQEGCQPCVPPVGSLRYRVDQVPPSRPHKPWPGTHWHIEQMHQVPAPACTCRWKEIANGQGPIPPGIPQQ